MSEGDHTQDYGIPFPCKTFGLNMIMLNTAQFMRNAGIDEEKYDRLAKMALNEMMNGGFADDEKKIIFEHVGFDGKRLNPPYGLDSCPGHIFEAAWFVLCESEIKDDADLRAFGKKLVDYAMPGMDGKRVFERILEMEYRKNTPVVFMTAVSDRKKIIEVLQHKPAGYVLKPPDKDKLMEKIEDVLKFC